MIFSNSTEIEQNQDTFHLYFDEGAAVTAAECAGLAVEVRWSSWTPHLPGNGRIYGIHLQKVGVITYKSQR